MNKFFIIKAHLLEEGVRVSDSGKKHLDKNSDIWLMDDYITSSGVTLQFGDQYVTTKVSSSSSYVLVEENGQLQLAFNDESVSVDVIYPPDYMHDTIIIGGKSITNYVNTYTDRIRIQLMCGCSNHCKFCNARDYRYEFNDIEHIDEAFRIALEQGKGRVNHVFISTNNVREEYEFRKITSAIVYFTERYPNVVFDLMTTPRGYTSYTDSFQYRPYLEYLHSIGVNSIAANMEINNPDLLDFYCPEKAIIGQERYLSFIEHAVSVFGINKVRSALIVGLEPLSETLDGVKKLAMRGCLPVLSPLYPYGEAQGDTSARLFIEARTKTEEICDRYGLQIGPLCRACSHNTL